MLAVHEELRESRERLVSDFRSGKVTRNFHEDYSEVMDHYFRLSIQESETGRELFSKKVQEGVVPLFRHRYPDNLSQEDT